MIEGGGVSLGKKEEAPLALNFFDVPITFTPEE